MTKPRGDLMIMMLSIHIPCDGFPTIAERDSVLDAVRAAVAPWNGDVTLSPWLSHEDR